MLPEFNHYLTRIRCINPESMIFTLQISLHFSSMSALIRLDFVRYVTLRYDSVRLSDVWLISVTNRKNNEVLS